MTVADLEITPRRPEDGPELLRIYANIYDEAAAEASRSRWRWQYEENPHSPGGPVLWVARREGLPIGQMGTMPVILWWGGEEVRASWGSDYFVRRDAEGRGYGVALVRAWTQSVDVALAIGLTPAAHTIYKRLGFRDFGRVPFFQAVLDPLVVARRRLGRVAGTLAAPFLRAALQALKGRKARAGKIEVRPTAEIGPEYDALWRSVRGDFAACVRRDAAYISWKYLRHPHKAYEILEARRGDRVTGFAVTRHEEYRGLRIGWLVDALAAQSDRDTRDALLSAALSRLKAARVARVQAFCANAELAGDLRRHGFFGGESRALFCVKATRVPSAPLDRLGEWHVMFGDSDMDR